ncbi:sigma-70 family RNA polymerase sigma factor [Aeromicrobium massiliense]|uniref:sigma-70 family RNA polymerase sigma factor n=1 Tax=Aeromicrobium massiliense TaxID=1464554 RepID=UPI0002ECE8B8|nr:sigma-70 family RNA polymerase sigma factor [Aeromicrobium massiliense]
MSHRQTAADRTSQHDVHQMLGTARAGTAERLAAENEVVRRHLRLAAALARRYHGRGVDDEDLVQVASLALVAAARRYDETRGDFASFATATVLGELKKHFRDLGWTVRPPRRIQTLQATIAAVDARAWDETGTGRAAELAARLGQPVADVLEALQARGCFHADSLDATEGEPSLGGVDDRFEQVDEWVSVTRLCRSLTDADRALLRMRFFEDLSQREIARRLDRNPMWVSRHLAALLGRLRTEAVVGEAA